VPPAAPTIAPCLSPLTIRNLTDDGTDPSRLPDSTFLPWDPLYSVLPKRGEKWPEPTPYALAGSFAWVETTDEPALISGEKTRDGSAAPGSGACPPCVGIRETRFDTGAAGRGRSAGGLYTAEERPKGPGSRSVHRRYQGTSGAQPRGSNPRTFRGDPFRSARACPFFRMAVSRAGTSISWLTSVACAD